MNKKILVCDDDYGITEVIKIVLEEKGYDVVVHSTGERITEVIKKEKPDLILIDLWIPGMSGDEVTRWLKNDKKLKHTPIIIVSANQDTAKAAVNSGADAFINKPFDIMELEATVAKYLAKASAA